MVSLKVRLKPLEQLLAESFPFCCQKRVDNYKKFFELKVYAVSAPAIPNVIFQPCPYCGRHFHREPGFNTGQTHPVIKNTLYLPVSMLDIDEGSLFGGKI